MRCSCLQRRSAKASTPMMADAERHAQERAEQRAQPAERADGRGNAQGPSVALVLADRSAAVRDAVEREYPHLVTAQSRRLSGSGGMAGWQAGQRARLDGGSRLGRRPRGRIAG